MLRNMRLIFREIKFPTSPCPPVQSICLKLYVKPEGGISSFPQSSTIKCWVNLARDTAKSNMNTCGWNPLSRSHCALLCHSGWSFEEGKWTFWGVHLFQSEQRPAVCCQKQTDRPVLKQLLRKEPRRLTWKPPPAKGCSHLYRENVTKSSLPSAFKRRVQRILKPWLMQ